MAKTNALNLADAQFIGYYHGKYQSLVQMVDSMALTKKEWEDWKKSYNTKFLTAIEIEEVNQYFKKKA